MIQIRIKIKVWIRIHIKKKNLIRILNLIISAKKLNEIRLKIRWTDGCWGTGFNELVPQPLLKSFDERELELVIGGLGKIDLEDWRTNTRLKHCQPDTPQVRRE